MKIITRLRAYADAVLVAFQKRVSTYERRHKGVATGPKFEPPSVYPKGQWHRWYKANRKRQRQVTALKQYGFRADPKSINLKRWMVR